MNDDVLDGIALLDPVDEGDAHADARAMREVVHARIAAAPAPRVHSRLLHSRRLHAIVAACLAIALVAFALVSLEGRGNTPVGQPVDGWIVVGSLQDLRSAKVTYVGSARAFVIARQGEQPYALSAVSPHSTYGFEEPLLYCRPAGQFVEPTHGSKFDAQGRYLVGPSPTGMYGVPLRVVNGNVEIDAATLSAAPSRAEHGDTSGFVPCPAEAIWSEPGFADVGGGGNSLFDLTFFHAPGADVSVGTFVSSVRGSNCSFPVPTWLQLTEPLGSQPASDADWRYYVADPEGVWSDVESSTYSRVDPLPSTAAFTGFRSHLFELWVDPAQVDREVWIVRNDPNGSRIAERWPRVEQIPQCYPPGSPSPAP